MELKRELSPNEKWYWISDSYSSSNIALMMSWERLIDEDEIRRCLEICQSKIEVLTCLLDDSDKLSPRWVRPGTPPKIPLRSETLTGQQNVTPSVLHAFAEEDCAIPLNTRETLLRGRMIQSSTSTGLVLSTPHFVADGASLRILGLMLNDCLLGLESDVKYYPLCEPLESFFPPALLGFSGFLKWFRLQLKTFLRESREKPFRIVPKNPLGLVGRKTRIVYFELESDASHRLFDYVARNRKDFTVNDYVLSVFSEAIAETFKVKEKSVAIGSPVNLQPKIERKDLFGPFVSAHVNYVPRSRKDFIQNVKLLRRRLKEFITGHDAYLTLKPLGFITRKTPDASKKLFKTVTKLGPGHITYSNMGSMKMPKDMSYFGFTASLNVSGLLLLGSYSLGDEKLRGCLNWVEDAVDKENAELILSVLLKKLKETPAD